MKLTFALKWATKEPLLNLKVCYVTKIYHHKMKVYCTVLPSLPSCPSLIFLDLVALSLFISIYFSLFLSPLFLSLSLSLSLSYMHSYYVLEFHSKRFKSSCLEIVRLSCITWISEKNKLLKSACNLDNIALLIFLYVVYGWQGDNDIMGVNVVVLFLDYPI